MALVDLMDLIIPTCMQREAEPDGSQPRDEVER